MSSRSPSRPAGISGLLAVCAAAALLLGAGPAAAEEPVATTPEATTPAAPAPVTAAPVATTPDPAGTVGAAPQQPLVATSADVFAPRSEIGNVHRQLEVARRSGLRVTFTLSEPASLRADVLIFGDVVDRELAMSALPAAGPGDSLAKATFTRSQAGTSVVRLPFNVAARRTLRKFFKLTVRVRLIAVDVAGNTSTAYKRVTLTLD